MTHTDTAQKPQSATRGVVKLAYTHEAMVDLILQDPTVTRQELAEVFGLTSAWVARVIASDSFQARLAERKTQLVDPQIAQSLNERLGGVAIQALGVVSEKLEAEQSASYAIDALGLAAKALGNGKHGKG